MSKRCEICDTPFYPNRKWQKYCSPKCQKKGKVENAIKWRKKQFTLYAKLSFEEIKNTEPHKSKYESVMKAFHDNLSVELSWSQLRKKSKISDRTVFNRYIKAFCRLGILKRKKTGFVLSDRCRLEPFKLWGRDIIMNTDLNCVIFHTSSTIPGLMYFNPWIAKESINYYVSNLDKRVQKIEEHLIKADHMWMRILSEGRENYIKQQWENKILKNKKIYLLTKFDFCLDVILKLREFLFLVSVTPDERSIKNQTEVLRDVAEKAFKKYIQKKYPLLTSSQIEKMHSKIMKNYEENKDFLDKLCQRIISLYMVNSLEHVILIGGPVSISDEHKEIRKMSKDIYLSIDVNKPIKEYRRESETLSKKKPTQDELTNKERTIYKDSIDEKLYIKPPFFKNFFHEFEESLIELGFKQGTDNDTLEDFFKDLDRTAKILKIPTLPDDPAGLL